MNAMLSPNPNFHIRPAQPGDICVLLEPTDAVEIARVAQKQRALRAQFGGQIVTPIHLTCARFVAHSPQQVRAFSAHIQANLSNMRSVQLTALGVQTLQFTHINTRILKWRVAITNELQSFVALLAATSISTGVTSLYALGAVSSLVSALHSVPILTPAELNQADIFPYNLYTGHKIVFSRIEVKGKFTLLETITF